MILAQTSLAGGSFGSSGQLTSIRPEAGLLSQTKALDLPSGLAMLATRMSWATYRSRAYGVGGGSDNVVIDEHFRCMRQGILPMVEVPTLTAAAGPGPSGDCVVAVAGYDQLADEWSPLSGLSNEVTLNNQSRTTGNIQATWESRVSHVGIWVSMDGSSFRLATKRQVGVTSVTENVATLRLGDAFFAEFERMPFGRYNAIYHERQFVAGDYLAPDTLYASALFFPERWESLSFQTRNGEPIIGLLPCRDILLVGTPFTIYRLRGYKEDDMSMEPIDFDMGMVNHFSGQVARGDGVFVNNKGWWRYNGAFHNIIQDNEQAWIDFYASNREQVEAGFGLYDPSDYTYTFYVTGEIDTLTLPEKWSLPPTSEGVGTASSYDLVTTMLGTLGIVAGMRPALPEVSGSFTQPDYSLDTYGRKISAGAAYSYPGARRQDVLLGSCDGKLREKDSTDDDDDSDTGYSNGIAKRAWIRTPAYNFGDPGGDIAEGKELFRAWTYMHSRNGKAWTLYVKPGDEEAWQMFLPDNSNVYWRDACNPDNFDDEYEYETVLGAALQLTPEPKTLWQHAVSRCSARLYTFEIGMTTSLGMRFRGLGGLWRPGRASRPPISARIEDPG